MTINLICVGKLSEVYLALFSHYMKMLKKYAKVEVIEIKEAPLPLNESSGDITRALDIEGKDILKRIKDRDFVYVLGINGEMLDSVAFSKMVDESFRKGDSVVSFVLGSSYGLSPEVYKRADYILSFGKMTLPHQLARVMLSEQLVRAFKINNNERYHK